MKSSRSLHHGVFPHKNDGISTQTLANILQLIGSNIVRGNDQNLGVLVEKIAQLLIVSDLLFSLGGFDRHWWRYKDFQMDKKKTKNPRAKSRAKTRLREFCQGGGRKKAVSLTPESESDSNGRYGYLSHKTLAALCSLI